MSTLGTDGTGPDALHDVQLLDAVDVEALPWTPVAGSAGVFQKVLWNVGGFTQALLRYEPGTSTPGEPHLAAHHHVWVSQGELTFAGRHMTAGSYAHVPPGARHSAAGVGPDGCTLLQMHRPHAPREGEALAESDRNRAVRHPQALIPGQGSAAAAKVRVPQPPVDAAPPNAADPSMDARVQLGSVDLPAGAPAVDGIWWPRSLDLVTEIQPLLAALPSAGQHARGVMYNLDAWELAPHKIIVGGVVVKLGGYRMLSPEVVHLTGTASTKALVLRVLPPSADPRAAAAALAAVRPLHKEPAVGPLLSAPSSSRRTS